MYNLHIYIHTVLILKAMKFKGCFLRLKKFQIKKTEVNQ